MYNFTCDKWLCHNNTQEKDCGAWVCVLNINAGIYCLENCIEQHNNNRFQLKKEKYLLLYGTGNISAVCSSFLRFLHF